MKVATYKGGMFGDGEGEKLQCDLCGQMDLEKLLVQNIGISAGMCGNDYTFCSKCWNGKNFGKRLLQHLGFPDGMILKLDKLDIVEIEDCK